MKVLIADDNTLYRSMLEQNVKNWGYEPVLAELQKNNIVFHEQQIN